jgi:Holliday junction resolvasome RuvABC DNA-binding subunit
MAEEICYYDQGTEKKVNQALESLGYRKHEAIAIITAIQAKGILFREKLPYI